MAALDRTVQALERVRPFALSIFLTYVLSSSVGILMAHAGSAFALQQRDGIVGEARKSAISAADRSGKPLTAAALDAGANFLAAVAQGVAGLAVVPPYFTVAYQGWIGGIVSVDGWHRSRLRSARGAGYYFTVLLLQFIPYSLCIGAGVRAGVDSYRHNASAGWRLRQYRIPARSLADLAVAHAVAVPLFLLASGFEFLSPWNG